VVLMAFSKMTEWLIPLVRCVAYILRHDGEGLAMGGKASRGFVVLHAYFLPTDFDDPSGLTN
jgi:hypothetical protein